MRLLTKKMKVVTKIPVELENKFCSHVDPNTSAHLINASELARLDPSVKFAKNWQDKIHVPATNDVNKVIPKNFYSNYKTNLIRDAHYLAG
jgi:hypothetical protein